ncbi:MAG: hypothetical protein V7785_11820 [Bermanella sp.]
MKKRYLFPLVSLAAVAVWGGNFLHDAGQFKQIDSHFSGSCQVIEGVVGAEDISFLPNQDVALISAYDRRAGKAGEDKKAGIFSYDLNTKAINKISPALDDFSPHGLSLYTLEDGTQRLFVINHANGQHQVNIFDLIDGFLVLKNTVQSSHMISPNDLVAVGPNQFYLTNDHKYASGIMHTLEDYLRWRVANVVFYDGENFKEVIADVGYANGINVSKDGELLYLNSITALNTQIFKRNKQNNELTLQETIHIGSGVDNIEVDDNGDLWMGAHPQLLKFVKHAEDENALSPSQVIKLSKGESGYQIEEVYLDSGAQMSGSSVAAVKHDRMLMGAVFDPKILDCTMALDDKVAEN